jgi:hypothetical protein
MKKLFLIIAMIGVGIVAGSSRSAYASTNINASTTSHWAWSDAIGWVDFYNTATVTVTAAKIEGYASSSAGDISFDCATTRNGNICGQSNYGVTNDGAGNLSGWAWNDLYGWISFDCGNTSGCGTSNYRAYIDGTGDFNNYAWNDVLGWISFNCADGLFCGTSNYKVNTSWQPVATTATLDSSIFDTGVTDPIGAKLNAVIWQGLQPTGTGVKFQFAVSNSPMGPWDYVGSDGTGSTYYAVDPDVSKALDYVLHAGRFFRYRITLTSNTAQTLTPRVDKVIVNWSP